jgi:CheY-like chemotaxis protein
MTRPGILVVEDEALVSLDLETLLSDAGYRVEGPVSTVSEALERLEAHRPAAAVVDVNVRDGLIFPVVDRLDRLSVPFVLLTGHSAAALPARFRGRPLVNKPFAARQLLLVLATVMQPEQEIIRSEG